MSSLLCDAILFDLDGVLVDSTPCASRIWGAWAVKHGLDPVHVVHAAHGQRTIETVRQVAPQLDARKEADAIDREEVDDVAGLRVLPGAKELLGVLPSDRYTIVTSGGLRLATARLQAAGLPVPANIVTGDDVAKGKPDPEPYQTGAKRLGRQPARCLVFEDAPPGIRSAKSAGATVVAPATTYPRHELAGADFIVDSLASVTASITPSGEIRVTLAGN